MTSQPLTAEDVQQLSEVLYENILSSAVRTPVGTIGWPVIRSLHGTGVDIHASLGLYQGNVGIAVYLAALYSVFEEEQHRRSAVKAIEAVDSAPVDADVDISGAEGLGSWIYGYTVLGDLLGAEAFLERAEDLAGCIPIDSIVADEDHDVMHGNAGLLLSLLALYERTGSEVLRGIARECVSSLLGAAEPVGRNRVAWPTVDDRYLSGFGHGAAGITYSLCRASAILDWDDPRDVALAGIRYENDSYDDDAGNWLDKRADTPPFMDGWCHGRTGVGLARLGCYDYGITTESYRDIERSIENLPDRPLKTADICHGTAARLTLLLDAAQILGSPFVSKTPTILDSLSRFAEQPDRVGREYSGLFLGYAGVGYTLLRTVDGSLPSILRWE